MLDALKTIETFFEVHGDALMCILLITILFTGWVNDKPGKKDSPENSRH